MADIAELVLGGVGTAGGVAVLARYIWETTRRRKEALEEHVEKARDGKLDTVLAKLGAVELELRSLLEKASTTAGSISEVKSRVEGISANHGNRLGTLEQTTTELRTRIVALESARASSSRRK